MKTLLLDPPPCQQDDTWHQLLTHLPADLDTLAFKELAYFRHRDFPNAATLLRLLLMYACGLSMPVVTAWAAATGLVTLTPEALHYRLKQARYWLAALVAHLLTDAGAVAALLSLGRVVLIDGTHASRPGVHRQDWHLHLAFDLHTATLTDTRVTSEHTGESFQQVDLRPGDVAVGDRNYGTRPNLWRALQAGAYSLVRFTRRQFSFYTLSGQHFPLTDALDRLAPEETAAWEVWLSPGKAPEKPPALKGRVIAYRLTEAQALRAVQHHARRRQQSGRPPASAGTAAGWRYVLLFTTAPEALLSADAALALYRLRWQIEMAIKRYKSLCSLGDLRTRTDACCQAVLWAKLLLILLLERTARTAGAFPPGAG
jgi:hypothetical protein